MPGRMAAHLVLLATWNPWRVPEVNNLCSGEFQMEEGCGTRQVLLLKFNSQFNKLELSEKTCLTEKFPGPDWHVGM